MPYDYTLRLTNEDGKNTDWSYQSLIRELGIEGVEAHGKPLSAGGSPQALLVKGLIEKADPSIQCAVFHNGSQIF